MAQLRIPQPWPPFCEMNFAPIRTYLHSVELEYACQQKNIKRAWEFALGRALVRYLVAQTGNLCFDGIEISLPSLSPPSLSVNRSPWHLSISHSEGAILAAVSRDNSVGVDIQFTSKNRNTSAFITEYSVFKDCTVDTFYSRWVALEAYAKFNKIAVVELLNQPFILPTEHRISHGQDNDYCWAAASHQDVQIKELATPPFKIK
ncbi:4'-phosphopantetheinyl transferase family protein [Aliidiomarina indica]|uniref:4'-phosphopantetheinyl transferase family protein n=1 Tax=Aliidiomarina indica TaxID=2749147 RepID=UPI001890B4D9|nr:hypothetical protein [Aliidiomarina indica]